MPVIKTGRTAGAKTGIDPVPLALTLSFQRTYLGNVPISTVQTAAVLLVQGVDMMLAWDDSLSSGIEEVDLQHKEFIKLIQRIQILHEKNASKDFTFRILQELLKYAEYHFASEENIMSVMRYPMIERHQAEHKKLLRGLGYWIGAFNEGTESLGSLLNFLCAWLLCHTRDEDSRIGKYVSEVALPGRAQQTVFS